MNLGPTELVLIGLVGWIVPIVAAYWIIRLAVRHGVIDAHRRVPGAERVLTSAESEDAGQSFPM